MYSGAVPHYTVVCHQGTALMTVILRHRGCAPMTGDYVVSSDYTDDVPAAVTLA